MDKKDIVGHQCWSSLWTCNHRWIRCHLCFFWRANSLHIEWRKQLVDEYCNLYGGISGQKHSRRFFVLRFYGKYNHSLCGRSQWDHVQDCNGRCFMVYADLAFVWNGYYVSSFISIRCQYRLCRGHQRKLVCFIQWGHLMDATIFSWDNDNNGPDIGEYVQYNSRCCRWKFRVWSVCSCTKSH